MKILQLVCNHCMGLGHTGSLSAGTMETCGCEDGRETFQVLHVKDTLVPELQKAFIPYHGVRVWVLLPEEHQVTSASGWKKIHDLALVRKVYDIEVVVRYDRKEFPVDKVLLRTKLQTGRMPGSNLMGYICEKRATAKSFGAEVHRIIEEEPCLPETPSQSGTASSGHS